MKSLKTLPESTNWNFKEQSRILKSKKLESECRFIIHGKHEMKTVLCYDELDQKKKKELMCFNMIHPNH